MKLYLLLKIHGLNVWVTWEGIEWLLKMTILGIERYGRGLQGIGIQRLRIKHQPLVASIIIWQFLQGPMLCNNCSTTPNHFALLYHSPRQGKAFSRSLSQ